MSEANKVSIPHRTWRSKYLQTSCWVFHNLSFSRASHVLLTCTGDRPPVELWRLMLLPSGLAGRDRSEI